MSKKSEQMNKKILYIMYILLGVAVLSFFSFSNVLILDLAEEVAGISAFAIILAFAVKKNTRLKTFYATFISILILVVGLYLYGLRIENQALITFMPEIAGGIFVGLLLSLIFKKKMVI